MRQKVISVLKMLGILVLSGIIGMLLLIAVYCLPANRIKSHIASGAYIYLQETAMFEYADGYVSTLLDNYTDALILSNVVYPSDHPVQDAVNVPRYRYEGSADSLELISYLNDTDGTHYVAVDTYPRYWHGYQVILRPFYVFFDFSDMEIFNQAMQLLLLFAVLLLMQKRGLVRYIPAFAMMILFWNPASMGLSLQYSPCYYISLAACAIILGKRNIPDIRRLFLMAGILTAYFDFLTYPAATLGVPLVMWLIVHRNDNGISIGQVIRNCIWWVIGYVGMWSEKWLIGTFLTGNNLFADAAGKIAERSSSQAEGKSISRSGTVAYLLRYSLAKWPYILLIGGTILGLLAVGIILRRRGQKHLPSCQISHITLLLLVGCIPFAWILMAANHCYIHPRLTYRVLGVMIFAWLSALTLLALPEKENRKQ